MEGIEIESVLYTAGSVLVAIISGYVGVRVATINANKKTRMEYNELTKKIDEQGYKMDEQGNKIDEQGKKIDEQNQKIDTQGRIQNEMRVALGKVETMVNILDRNFTTAKKN